MSMLDSNIAPKVLYSLAYGSGCKLTVDLLHIWSLDLRGSNVFIRMENADVFSLRLEHEDEAAEVYDAILNALRAMVELGGGINTLPKPSEG